MPYLADIVAAVQNGYFVSSGCEVQSLAAAGQGDDGYGVYVNGGTAVVSGTPVTVAGQRVAVAAPTLSQRQDLIVVDSGGVCHDLAGTTTDTSIYPVFTGYTPLAGCLVQSSIVVTPSGIADIRQLWVGSSQTPASGFGHLTVTVSSLPSDNSAASAGRLAQLSSDNSLWNDTGSAWASLSSKPLLLAYNQVTSDTSITATTAGSANTIVTSSSFSSDGSTPILVEFFSPAVIQPGTTSEVIIVLYRDGSLLSVLDDIQTASGQKQGVFLRQRDLPSAGSHTYSVRAYVNGGTGTVKAGSGTGGANAPAYIRCQYDI